MPITIKDEAGIAAMREACRLAAEVLDSLTPHVQPGITTLEIDRLAAQAMAAQGTRSATIGYQPPGYPPYPAHLCTSVNQVVCHGIPADKPLKKGDIVNVDVTVITPDGWYGDTSRMFEIGDCSIWTDQRCWGQGVVDGTIPPVEPPQLPDPGEQPADAEAAEAAVRAALDDLFSAPVEEGREFFDLLDDASGIDLGVADQMENHADLETLLTKGDATITDLVFISPIEAFYFYDLETPLAPVINRFGRARVVDGVWKITRGTFCQEILNYGVFCGV